MVECTACNTQNEDNAKFCKECGTPLEKDRRPDWVKKYYEEKEEEKKAETFGLFKIESINTGGENQEIKMVEDGIKTSNDQFIRYRDIESIEGKTNVSRKNTLMFGVAGLVGGLTLQIIFKGGKILIRDINKTNANNFILAVRKKINESNNSQFSSMDELKKLAELREMGVITEEEYEKKKNQLLD